MCKINEKIILEVVNINREKPSIYTFDVADLIGYSNDVDMLNDIKYISKIIVPKEKRNNGIGTKSLLELCKSMGEDKFILITAGALMDEYPKEPTTEEYNLILNRLDKFFKNIGFIDVNDRIGCYECKCSYLFGNKAGLELIKSFKE